MLVLIVLPLLLFCLGSDGQHGDLAVLQLEQLRQGGLA